MIYVLNIDDYSVREMELDIFIMQYNSDEVTQANTYLFSNREDVENFLKQEMKYELLAL